MIMGERVKIQVSASAVGKFSEICDTIGTSTLVMAFLGLMEDRFSIFFGKENKCTPVNHTRTTERTFAPRR